MRKREGSDASLVICKEARSCDVTAGVLRGRKTSVLFGRYLARKQEGPPGFAVAPCSLYNTHAGLLAHPPTYTHACTHPRTHTHTSAGLQGGASKVRPSSRPRSSGARRGIVIHGLRLRDGAQQYAHTAYE
eukprot:1158897-Pelagomonas_calceolata.AAC.3